MRMIAFVISIMLGVTQTVAADCSHIASRVDEQIASISRLGGTNAYRVDFLTSGVMCILSEPPVYKYMRSEHSLEKIYVGVVDGRMVFSLHSSDLPNDLSTLPQQWDY